MSAALRATSRLCGAPDAPHPAFGRAGLGAARACAAADQGEGDLGARMARALERARCARTARALLIGTDAPALDALAHGAGRARRWRDHDAVFVPALDGGYALVGLRRPAPALFAGMAWSTPQVMAAHPRARCARPACAWPSCPPWPTSTSPPTWPTCLRAGCHEAPAADRCRPRPCPGAAGLGAPPVPGCELVVVSPKPLAPYSGMVPGWLAGTYRFDEIGIDFPPCAPPPVHAGCRTNCSPSTHAPQPAPGRRRGARLRPAVAQRGLHADPAAHRAATLLSMRPLASLHDAWDALLRRWHWTPTSALSRHRRRWRRRGLRIAARRAGAAACTAPAAPRAGPPADARQQLAARPGPGGGACRACALAAAGVTVQLGTPGAKPSPRAATCCCGPPAPRRMPGSPMRSVAWR